MTTASFLMTSAIQSPGISRFRSGLWHLFGIASTVALSSWAAWGHVQFWQKPGATLLVALTVGAYVLAAASASRFTRFPMMEGIGVALLSVLSFFFLLLIVIAITRIYYSRSFLLVSFFTSCFFLLLRYRFWARSLDMQLAVVPGGLANELFTLASRKWVRLENPDSITQVKRADGVVVDFHAALVAGNDWVRVLANATLKGMPVFHAAFVYESITGTVSLKHISDAQAGEFRLDPLYVIVKRLTDIFFTLISLPVVLPLCFLAALAIKLESRGPALFIQERVGPGGKPFKMVKFRTMTLDSESQGPALAARGDRRITRIGKILRKYRIDELPQFWNILKGEMSLIGPRPEQVSFAEAFEKNIPFYAFRHLVRPGITGWAQVNYGYAGDEEQTRKKLEYDLFYTKYFSFSLDALVIFKTVKIIFTGFGAR